MRKGVKILLIVGSFMLMAMLNSMFMEGSGSKTGGIVGLILFIGWIAGARAIWKYNPEATDNSSDKHTLDKK